MARPPDTTESRDQYLRVRIAAFEASWLDALRGEISRSDYVRQLITSAAHQDGLV